MNKLAGGVLGLPAVDRACPFVLGKRLTFAVELSFWAFLDNFFHL